MLLVQCLVTVSLSHSVPHTCFYTVTEGSITVLHTCFLCLLVYFFYVTCAKIL